MKSGEGMMPRRNATTIRATVFAFTAAMTFAISHLPAQIAGPPEGVNSFHDTSMLKPPAGQKVAIIVFEDMECPACAHSHPIEEQAAAQYHVPLVRYDFPLQMHIWSRDAAIFARYLQDKVSPQLAGEYRTALFAQQISIGSKDDLQNFTRRFMQQHGQSMPFVVDPTGALAAQVNADFKLGERLNVTRTPTIVVVTPTKYQVISGNDGGSSDANRLFPVLDAAVAQTKGGARTVRTAAHR